MEKYTRLAALFLELTIDGPLEIPAEFLNIEFPVWSMEASGNGRTGNVNAIVDGFKLSEHLRQSGYGVNNYGDFLEEGEFSTPMIVLGDLQPSSSNIYLELKTLAEIAAYCYKHDLGIGVLSTEAGFHLAANAFLVPALSAIYDVVQSESRKKFLEKGCKVELPLEVDSQVNKFLTSFSSFLESIDYATMDVGDENRLVFYLNFKDSVDDDDVEKVQMELVEILEKLEIECHVSYSIGESELSNPFISRLTPSSFEAEFSRYFGPSQN